MIARIFSQLKRRGVLRAAIAYVVGAWALIEGTSILVEAFGAPDVLVPLLFVLLSLGLPAVLAFAWFFDITPDGIRRTQPTEDDGDQAAVVDRRVYFVMISLLAAALALSIYGNIRQPSGPPELVSILIADFDNEAGNELFSGIIEESLRVGLEVAPFVESYSRKRAGEIATSIGAGDNGKLSLETAGRIALRESINIVIGGSVRRDGKGVVSVRNEDGGLIVTATGFSPGDQRELFAVTETAKTDAEILSIVAKISEKLRRELGDTKKPAGAGESDSFVVANLEAAAEYLKAQELQRDRKLEAAIVHYEKAVELDPGFARAYAGLALTEDYLGRSEAAAQHWKQAISGLSTLTERGQLRTLGNYYLVSQQDYAKALETYERLVERYPADNVAHNNLAVAAFYMLDFERALEVGREVANRFPKNSGYGGNLALFAMYASRFDVASDAAEKVFAIDPGNAYANFVHAQTLAAAGKLDAAEAAYQKMFGYDQFARSVAAEGIADLALYQGDVEKALQQLDSAIEVETGLGAYNNVALKQVMRAEAYLLAGDKDNAMAAANAALGLESNDTAVLVPAAMAFIQLGEYSAAQSIIDGLAQGFSDSKRGYAEALRAEIAIAQGDTEAALTSANAAIGLADLWLIRLIRANVSLQADRMGDAQADIEECQRRIGEGIAVFLNDRPTLRMLRRLETAQNSAGLTSKKTRGSADEVGMNTSLKGRPPHGQVAHKQS